MTLEETIKYFKEKMFDDYSGTPYLIAIEAMELQVAKKVETTEGDCGRTIPICPSCECLLEEYEIATERCCECGQLLDTEDWSEE